MGGLAEDAESQSLRHTIKMLDLGKQNNVRLSKETADNRRRPKRSMVLARTRWAKSVKHYAPSLE